MRKWVLITALACMPCGALAAGRPPELAGIITAETPTGTARLTKLFLHVYDVEFWSDNGGWTTPPYGLSVTYAMAFTADDLTARTLSEMQQVSDFPSATLRFYASQLQSFYPAVESGDRVTALQENADTTLFFLNGKLIGQMKDSNFATAFFGIWLSLKSSEPAMRQKLLSHP